VTPLPPPHRDGVGRNAILTVTLNPALDIAGAVARLEPERKLHCSHVTTRPGGGGINVARAIRELGGEAVALFPCGGSTGAVVCALLRAEGVAILPVEVSGVTREDFAITDLEDGHQYRFVLPGPELGADDFNRCEAELERRLSRRALVVISGSLPPGVTPAQLAGVARVVRAGGSRLLVDTSGPALAAVAEVGADLLKPSVNELSTHAGRALSDDGDIAAAARALLGAGPNRAVLVSQGGAGALLVSADGPVRRFVPPPVPVVSVVGAGDSLVGATALALAQGRDLVAATTWGVAAGTAATMADGNLLCRRADVLAVLPRVAVRALDDRQSVTA